MKQVEISWHCEFIAALVSEYPEGIGISVLEQAFARRCGNVSRRTLQRRLERLIQDGRITAEGQNVARVYKSRVTARRHRVEEPGANYDDEIIHVPVSWEGEEIRAQIRKPLLHRCQVGYEQKFLENYEPGVSRYLSEPVLARLHEIGRTPETGSKIAGAHARGILGRLRTDLSWASSRLEGCTYTQLEAKSLILSGKPAPGRHMLETRMILNHGAAVAMLLENADKTGLDVFTFRSLHAILSSGANSTEVPGTVFSPAVMPQFVESRFFLFLEKVVAITDPFEQALFTLAQLPYLQPFPDANKTVSRLAMNIPLFKCNFYPLLFVNVPGLAYTEGMLGIYELGRIELLRDIFVWAYEQSCLYNR